MNEYDPRELIAICEGILEDNEVTYDEVYNLADWLNNHREACFNWPGDALVRPLQQVWADAKLTKTELMSMAKLLREIRSEWVRRQSTESLERARQYAQELASTMPPREPLLPPINVTLQIRSSSEPRLHYDVCLLGPTCTCPDWIKTRRSLSEGDLSRACKHVLDAYSQIVPKGLWHGWLGAFLDVGWRAEPSTRWRLLQINGTVYLLNTPGATGWANIYCDMDGNYERFGYNIPEQRWAYGLEPADGDRLAAALCS